MKKAKSADLETVRSDLKARLDRIEQDIEKLLDIQLQAKDASVDSIFRDKLVKLSDERDASRRRLGEVELNIEDVISPMKALQHIQLNAAEFRRGWGKAPPAVP